MREQFGPGFEHRAYRRQFAAAAGADRDDEVLPEEQRHRAGLDHLGGFGQLGVLDVPGGPDDRERHVAVPFDLRPLELLERVLDGQFVQLEGVGDVGELVLARLVQAEPDERLRPAARLDQRLFVVPVPGLALPGHVERALVERADEDLDQRGDGLRDDRAGLHRRLQREPD